MKLFDKSIDIIGWIQIFLAPFFLGLLIGGCMYVFSTDTLFKVIGLGIIFIGIVLGIVLANYTKKSGGTQETIQQLNHSPDWNDLAKEMREKEEREQNPDKNI